MYSTNTHFRVPGYELQVVIGQNAGVVIDLIQSRLDDKGVGLTVLGEKVTRKWVKTRDVNGFLP